MLKPFSLVLVLLAGCSSPKPSPESTTTKADKTEAPVDLKLSASATSGAARVRFDITARADIPSVAARFVLSDGVKLVGGTLEQSLGAMRSGETRQVHIDVDIPLDRATTIAGGVDVMPAGNVLLHRSAAPLVFGPAAAPAAEPKVVNVDGENVRMAPAQ